MQRNTVGKIKGAKMFKDKIEFWETVCSGQQDY